MLLALLLGGVTITLSPEAKVRGTEVQLAAIATFEGDDPLEVERVRALRLGYAPAPGYTRMIPAARLSAELARLLPGVAVQLKGAQACRVSPETERVSAATVEAAARAEVQRWLDGREIELTLLNQVADLEVPAGTAPAEVRAVLADANLRPGPINVPVRVVVDGTLYRTIWSNWRLGIWEDASVLRRAVKAGELITLDMLEKQRVLSTGGAGDATLAPGLAIGGTARRELPAGSALRESDVQRTLIVKRGDTLFVEVRRGSINARVAAIAEQDAHAGDRIRVTLLQSKRSLSATVVARDLARIELESKG